MPAPNRDVMLTPNDIEVLCRGLDMRYTTLSNELGVDVRTLRRYRRGEYPLPAWLGVALEGVLCRTRHQGRVLEPVPDAPPGKKLRRRSSVMR